MRALFVALALVAGFLFSPGAQAARPLPKPQLIAVYFYADWCPNCKLLSPDLQKARESLNEKDVLFVTLDLTDKARIHQSILLGQTLGIGEFMRAQGSATGYVAILDAKTFKELARYDRTYSATAITDGISKLLH